MKLGIRIFGCYLAIFCICFAYPAGWVLDTLRTRYLEGVEDPLVDQANILAEWVGQRMASKSFSTEEISAVFRRIYARDLGTRIYHLTKSDVDVAVYITDAAGRVVYHSRDPSQIGRDYTRWRDVQLTLEGQYGARTTLADPADETSSVLFVAAPIIIDGKTVGVLTVAKPTTNINSFLRRAKPQLIKVVALSVLAAVVLGYLVALWITRPIQRLTDYAHAVHNGSRATFPELDRTEIGTMGRALKKMQDALEGKAYVERYVQQLTHEVKSPLSAIRGAAELLEENVPPEKRKRFLTHIRTEANRIQRIVDRMLTLAALENRKQLTQNEPVDLNGLVNAVLESKQSVLPTKDIAVTVNIPDNIKVKGDPFWLHQALANLIQNAIDFSRPRGTITVTAGADAREAQLFIEDNGAAIPPYALDKIFEKFYSLKRPDSGRKSTGLGLNLVRQVALLHNGSIALENLEPRGVRAILTLPVE
jgi:two-component system, OmpR family, sensor histidine kinase CreC